MEIVAPRLLLYGQNYSLQKYSELGDVYYGNELWKNYVI